MSSTNNSTPRSPLSGREKPAKRTEATCKELHLFTVDAMFGDLKQVQAAHVNDDGLFDQITK